MIGLGGAPQIGSGDPDIIDQPVARTKDEWLSGPDLAEQTVQLGDGKTVRVRELTAGEQARISDLCTSIKGQRVKVDQERVQCLTFSYGCIDPKFDEHEARRIAQKTGSDFALTIGVINAISGATEEHIERAQARFPRR